MEWTQERREELDKLSESAVFGFHYKKDILAALAEIDRLTARVEALEAVVREEACDCPGKCETGDNAFHCRAHDALAALRGDQP